MCPRSAVRALALVALWATVAQAGTVVLLSKDGIDLRPGRSNSEDGTTSLIDRPASIAPWDVTPELWAETVACVREIYAPFDVTFTEERPESGAYIEAVFGGSPKDLGLPRHYTGVSPFLPDCSVIERSIVFAFTDVLAPDPTRVCHVIAQEIGHSLGLDHTLLESDPMSVSDYHGPRAFADEAVACGEDSPRPCGLPRASCREMQNSYALLAERVGLANASTGRVAAAGPEEVGCSAGGGGAGGGALLFLAALIRRLTCRGRS